MKMLTIDKKEVIVLGDKTTHGGKVISASAMFSYGGIQVARVGDKVYCPKCDGTHTIIEGASFAFNNSLNITRHGDVVSCGARLLAGTSSKSVEDAIKSAAPLPTDEKDRLILCLSEMAANEAEKLSEPDKTGWMLLHDGIDKWLDKRADKGCIIRDKYDNGGQAPTKVDWSWMMRYPRFARAVEEFRQEMADVFLPGSRNLLSEKVKSNLAVCLRKPQLPLRHKDCKIRGGFCVTLKEEGSCLAGTDPCPLEDGPFDHAKLDWSQWRGAAIHGKTAGIGLNNIGEILSLPDILTTTDDGKILPDGFQVALGETTILALAAGKAESNSVSGKTRITVTDISFFIHDGFEFSGDQYLGSWKCEPGQTGLFITSILSGSLWNSDFNRFRERTGYGCDFRSICDPELVVQGNFQYEVDT